MIHHSAWQKNNTREIRHTLGRYLAILAIVALGVGFFSGLKVTKSAMIKTGNTYISDSAMFDYRLISTLGLTLEDVDSFLEIPGIQSAEGSFSTDFIASTGEKSDIVLKAVSLPEKVNQVTLSDGQMPQSSDECLLDDRMFDNSMLGQTISVSTANTSETADNFTYSSYTVSGLCHTPLYLNMERGTTSLGNGALSGFVFISSDGLNNAFFSDVYLKLDSDDEIYSNSYNDTISQLRGGVENSLTARAELRYQQIVSDAQSELDRTRTDYDDGTAEYEQQKIDAETALSDARTALDDAKKQIDDNEVTLTASEAELESKKSAYTLAKSEYDRQYQTWQTSKAAAGSELTAAQEELDLNLSDVTAGIAAIDESGVPEQYAALSENAVALKEALEQLINQGVPETDESYTALIAQLSAVSDTLVQIEASGIITQYQTLLAGKDALADAQSALDVKKSETQASLDDAKSQLDNAVAQLLSAETQIANGSRQLSEGQTALANAKAQYEEGLSIYEAQKTEAETALADGKTQLDNAFEEINTNQQKIDDITPADTYCLDRTTNTGYVCFENDASVVEGVARIFPIFFFLVAALVCTTTMTRMIDEQRTQIGTLKALGYSSRKIILRYVTYSGSAACIGCVSGFAIGSLLFPFAIWQAYTMLYKFSSIIYVFNGELAVISLVVALLCSAGATLAAGIGELIQLPAPLMRPKSPKSGKRILLEYLPFIWKRIDFLHKVSVRNILRYKKRLFMMLLGIGGCTALLLTGLGVKDSISNIAEDQFTNIMKYDYSLTFDQNMSAQDQQDFKEAFAGTLDSCVFIHQSSYTADCQNEGQKTVYVIASDDDDLSQIIGFAKNGTVIPFPETGSAIISSKLAEMAGVSTGDILRVKTDDTTTVSVPVAGVFDNYIYNYIYMNTSTYTALFDKDCTFDGAFAAASDTNSDALYSNAAQIQKNDRVSSISITEEFRSRVANMMTSLNGIIIIVIVFAAALAFVVIYNLSNINITERTREIATIKVLGFYPNETSAYVFRENIVLTILGALAGIPAGIALHHFVMANIKIDMVSFNVHILPQSYAFAMLITFGLTFFVSLILERKINRIDMAASLKSVE